MIKCVIFEDKIKGITRDINVKSDGKERTIRSRIIDVMLYNVYNNYIYRYDDNSYGFVETKRVRSC